MQQKFAALCFVFTEFYLMQQNFFSAAGFIYSRNLYCRNFRCSKNFSRQNFLAASNTVRKHYQGGYEFSFICDVSCVTLFIDCDINQLSA